MNQQDNEELTISIQDIISILLSKIKFILLITALFTVGAFCIAEFVLPVKYTSNIRIYVKNSDSSTTANGQAAINNNDLIAAKSLVETYIVILDDNSVYEQVSDKLLGDYEISDLEKYFTIQKDDEGKDYISSEEIRNLVTMSAVNQTEVLQISCTSQVPQISADICTYISDIAPALIKRVTQAGSVETISPAQVPTKPSAPNKKMVTLVGCMLGLVISIAIVFIMHFADNAVKSGEDVKARFGVPVLAEIPDIFMEEKGAGKYAKYSK